MKEENLIVSMQSVEKSFGGVHALKHGRLELRRGEILGLIESTKPPAMLGRMV